MPKNGHSIALHALHTIDSAAALCVVAQETVLTPKLPARSLHGLYSRSASSPDIPLRKWMSIGHTLLFRNFILYHSLPVSSFIDDCIGILGILYTANSKCLDLQFLSRMGTASGAPWWLLMLPSECVIACGQWRFAYIAYACSLSGVKFTEIQSEACSIHCSNSPELAEQHSTSLHWDIALQHHSIVAGLQCQSISSSNMAS